MIIGIIFGIVITSLITVPRIVCLQDELFNEMKHNMKLEQRINELMKEGK